MWEDSEDIISPAAQYSLFTDPLPWPPSYVFQNSAAAETILSHLQLFTITCNIYVNVLKSVLVDHPNPLFVNSVLVGL